MNTDHRTGDSRRSLVKQINPWVLAICAVFLTSLLVIAGQAMRAPQAITGNSSGTIVKTGNVMRLNQQTTISPTALIPLPSLRVDGVQLTPAEQAGGSDVIAEANLKHVYPVRFNTFDGADPRLNPNWSRSETTQHDLLYYTPLRFEITKYYKGNDSDIGGILVVIADFIDQSPINLETNAPNQPGMGMFSLFSGNSGPLNDYLGHRHGFGHLR